METDITEGGKSFSFWKNLFLVVFFFTLTPLTLATSLFSLVTLKKANELQQIAPLPRSGFKVYASLPSGFPTISSNIAVADARSEIIKQYFAAYSSPLEPYASLIVGKADQYSLDYRLITAIAQQESNLCKKYPEGTFNCWGWGIHSEGTLGFSSFEEGIDTVSRGLREEYLNKGYETVDEIMEKYTPLSPGTWAQGVTSFMNEMR